VTVRTLIQLISLAVVSTAAINHFGGLNGLGILAAVYLLMPYEMVHK